MSLWFYRKSKAFPEAFSQATAPRKSFKHCRDYTGLHGTFFSCLKCSRQQHANLWHHRSNVHKHLLQKTVIEQYRSRWFWFFLGKGWSLSWVWLELSQNRHFYMISVGSLIWVGSSWDVVRDPWKLLNFTSPTTNPIGWCACYSQCKFSLKAFVFDDRYDYSLYLTS